MNDLLTLYLADEASADTRALIEDRARREPAFAARLAAARAVDLTAAAVPAPPLGDAELRSLKRTRHAIFLRTLFWAAGLFFTLLPLVFHGDGDSVEFLFLGRHPGLVWAFWSVAAASWIGVLRDEPRSGAGRALSLPAPRARPERDAALHRLGRLAGADLDERDVHGSDGDDVAALHIGDTADRLAGTK